MEESLQLSNCNYKFERTNNHSSKEAQKIRSNTGSSYSTQIPRDNLLKQFYENLETHKCSQWYWRFNWYISEREKEGRLYYTAALLSWSADLGFFDGKYMEAHPPDPEADLAMPHLPAERVKEKETPNSFNPLVSQILHLTLETSDYTVNMHFLVLILQVYCLFC